MSTIDANTLAQQLQSESPPVVLDIRHSDEYEDWHIPDSINIDLYDQLRENPSEVKDSLRTLPDQDVVTICGMGMVSQTATEVLDDLGYEAKTLEEGMVGWSQLHQWAPVPIDIAGTLLQVTRPGKGCLSYVLISDGEAVVFDASQYIEEYESILTDYDAELVAVYETHAHADHLSGGYRLANEYGVPYHLHPDDAMEIDSSPVTDGDTVRIGNVEVTVLHTPGHSPGGVSYDIAGEAILTGDTLFHESVGRVELGAAVGLEDEAAIERNAERLFESINRILDRGDDQLVLPAHDPGSPFPPVSATIAEVKSINSDVGLDRSTFVAELASNVPDQPPNVQQIKRANVGLEDIDPADRTHLELGPNRCAVE